MLQRVAACFVAVCCHIPCVIVCCSKLERVIRCSTLCCSVLQCVAVRHAFQCDTACCSELQYVVASQALQTASSWHVDLTGQEGLQSTKKHLAFTGPYYESLTMSPCPYFTVVNVLRGGKGGGVVRGCVKVTYVTLHSPLGHPESTSQCLPAQGKGTFPKPLPPSAPVYLCV